MHPPLSHFVRELGGAGIKEKAREHTNDYDIQRNLPAISN